MNIVYRFSENVRSEFSWRCLPRRISIRSELQKALFWKWKYLQIKWYWIPMHNLYLSIFRFSTEVFSWSLLQFLVRSLTMWVWVFVYMDLFKCIMGIVSFPFFCRKWHTWTCRIWRNSCFTWYTSSLCLHLGGLL